MSIGDSRDWQLRHRPATRAAMKRLAESRRCPKCGRGAALKRVRMDAHASVLVCRWQDCRYERATDAMPPARPRHEKERDPNA